VAASANVFVTRELDTSAALLAGSGGMTPQQVRDAAALALTPGTVPVAGSIDVKVDAVATAVGTVGTDLGVVAADVALIRKVEEGDWEMVSNQLIYYDVDGSTVLEIWDLFNAAGQPAMTDVVKRVRHV
jgi:hypothetical protein